MPRSLSFLAYGVMIVLILGIVNQQLELLPQSTNGGGEDIPNVEEPPANY